MVTHVYLAQQLLLDSVPAVEGVSRPSVGPGMGLHHPRPHSALRGHYGDHMVLVVSLVPRPVVQLLTVAELVLGDVECHDHLAVCATPQAPLGMAGKGHWDQGGAQGRDPLGESGHGAHGEDSGVLPVVKVGDIRRIVVLHVLIAEDEVTIASDHHHVSAEWEVERNVGGMEQRMEFTCVEGRK